MKNNKLKLYTELAHIYDEMYQHIFDYDEQAQYIDDILKAHDKLSWAFFCVVRIRIIIYFDHNPGAKPRRIVFSQIDLGSTKCSK